MTTDHSSAVHHTITGSHHKESHTSPTTHGRYTNQSQGQHICHIPHHSRAVHPPSSRPDIHPIRHSTHPHQALFIQSLPNTRQSSAIRHLTAIPAQFVNTRPAIYRTRLTRRAVRRPIALGLHHHPGLHWDCDPPAIGAVKFKQDRRPL